MYRCKQSHRSLVYSYHFSTTYHCYHGRYRKRYGSVCVYHSRIVEPTVGILFKELVYVREKRCIRSRVIRSRSGAERLLEVGAERSGAVIRSGAERSGAFIMFQCSGKRGIFDVRFHLHVLLTLPAHTMGRSNRLSRDNQAK